LIEHFRRKKRFFLVFEYLEYTILEELEKNGSLDFSTSRKYIYQVLRALNFIHSNNVIHRDIKPENVLVSRLGVIKLCDFGFARPYGDMNDTLTDYVATRWYRSPELLVGDPHYGKGNIERMMHFQVNIMSKISLQRLIYGPWDVFTLK
jgi:cyclin-dependent kinase-like